MERIFLMLCSDATVVECFERQMFGTGIKMRQALQGLQPGDLGFLYHFERDSLFGPFRATTPAQLNFEPAAWGRRYPVQFRVAWDEEPGELRNAIAVFRELGIHLSPLGHEALHLVPSSPLLTGSSAEALFRTFQRKTGVPPQAPPTETPSAVTPLAEVEDRHPIVEPEVRCEDGYTVISVGEVNLYIDQQIRSGLIGRFGLRPESLPGEIRKVDPADDGIQITPEFETLFSLLESDRRLIFLAGKAGTGKSTLVKLVRERFRTKSVAVVAPTGIAALNAEGQTIHSFFRIPINDLNRTDRIPDASVIRELDLLIIDEISMVRADLLDAVDRSLRVHRGATETPFGGVQVLFVGDLFQLPPIVLSEEAALFSGGPYLSPWFFSAKSLQSEEMACLELTHVFRQENQEFLRLLEQVRESVELEACVATLNQQDGAQAVVGEESELDDSDRLLLCCHNQTAEDYNQSRLAALSSAARTYSATVEGDFPDDKLSCPKELVLKPGTPVLFCRNDNYGRWVNGTLGVVESLENDLVLVRTREGQVLRVSPVTWENYTYEYNGLTRRVATRPIGKFSQIPLRLAWAISIHKSQGMTLDEVQINLGDGAFANGQVYVALSRCRSLPGISLSRPIRENDIRTDRRVSWFYRAVRGEFEGISAEEVEVVTGPPATDDGFLIQLPEATREKLVARAQREDCSVEEMIANLIEEQFRPRW